MVLRISPFDCVFSLQVAGFFCAHQNASQTNFMRQSVLSAFEIERTNIAVITIVKQHFNSKLDDMLFFSREMFSPNKCQTQCQIDTALKH